MTTTANEKCQESIPDGGRSPLFHKCGRPVVEDGLCKLHLGARARRLQKVRESAEKNRRVEAARKSAETWLSDRGLQGRPTYDSIRNEFNGQVSVDPAELDRFVSLRERAAAVTALRYLAERQPKSTAAWLNSEADRMEAE